MKALFRRGRLLVDIQKNEVAPAILFFLFWFFIILAFQILRPLKKGVFVAQLGPHLELYAKLCNIAVALLAVVVFTAIYNLLGSRRLVAILCAVFCAAFSVLAWVFSQGEPNAVLNWMFYLFGDAWSTIWVTTFWAYLNEMTEVEQSKRLYGVIGGGGVVGGLLGNLGVWQLVEPLGSPVLLAACGVIAVLIGVMVWRLEVVAARPGGPIGRRLTGRSTAAEESRKWGAAVEGARLVASSKYLSGIVATVFLYELVSQVLDYQYSTTARALLSGTAELQAFFGQVGSIVGVISVVVQFFLVSLVIRKLGMTWALLILPGAMMAASGGYLAAPLLATAALLSISDNALAYSINQTARETLYMPRSPDVKYKARAFANMFVQRCGKGVAILAALALYMVPVRFLSVLAMLVSLLWMLVAGYLGRRFERETAVG
jgi:AAA family ATP:ADP antiporter